MAPIGVRMSIFSTGMDIREDPLHLIGLGEFDMENIVGMEVKFILQS